MASSGYVTGVREQAMGGWSLLAVVVGIGQDAGMLLRGCALPKSI